MKAMKLWLVFCTLTVLTVAGCGRHHGMGPYGRGDMDAVGDKANREMSELIDKTVQDPERAKRARAIVAEIVEEVKQLYRQNRQHHRKLYELNENYQATPEEFMKILDEVNNSRMRSGAKILGMRFKLKELLTAEEWKALTDGMNKYRASYWHDKEGAEVKKEGA
jgi:thiamine biosynthesis lipoprotein ApbE